MPTNNDIRVHISQRELRTGNVERFRFLFAARRENFQGLVAVCGTVRPVFPKLDTEIFLDPVSRRFCSALYDVFPFWMLFLSLSDRTLWNMSLAVLKNLRMVETSGKQHVSVDPIEANRFVIQQIERCVRLTSETGIDPKLFRAQMSRASRYYGDLIKEASTQST